MKKFAVLFLAAFFLLILGCGGGGNSSGPENNKQIVVAPETIITPLQTTEVNAVSGGVISVADERMGNVAVQIPSQALQQNTAITVSNVDNPPVLNGTGFNFVGNIVDLKPDGTKFQTTGQIKIPFSDTDLKNAGVLSKESLRLYVYDKEKGIWEEEKVASVDLVNNVLIGDVNHFSMYSVVGLSGTEPRNLGTPRPGDILARLTTYNDGKTSGWAPGHFGMYVGEMIWDGSNPDYVSPDVKRFRKFNVVESLGGKGVVLSYYKIPNTVQTSPVETTFQGNAVYLGAREPAKFTLTNEQRKLAVDYVLAQVGKPYATGQTYGALFGLLEGRHVKGPDSFNCVGLIEKAYEFAQTNLIDGRYQGIMPNDDFELLTPADMYRNTIPAGGEQEVLPIINSAAIWPESGRENTVITLSVLVSHPYGSDFIDMVTYATDFGYVNRRININDEGLQGDRLKGDGVYSASYYAGGAPFSRGVRGMTVTVTDKAGKTASRRLTYTYTDPIFPKALSEQYVNIPWVPSIFTWF